MIAHDEPRWTRLSLILVSLLLGCHAFALVSSDPSSSAGASASHPQHGNHGKKHARLRSIENFLPHCKALTGGVVDAGDRTYMRLHGQEVLHLQRRLRDLEVSDSVWLAGQER